MITTREFEITQEMTKMAIPLNPEKCVIALAIAAQLPSHFFVNVGTNAAYFSRDLTMVGMIQLTREACLIRRTFDFGKRIPSQKFTLEGDWSFLA
jgi:hypothetical protein